MIDDKINALAEKVAIKQKKLADVLQVIEHKKNTAKILSAEIENLLKSIFDLEAQKLFSKLKNKGVGITSVIEAIDAGVFDNDTFNGNNIAQNDEQEESTDEISSSGKTIGNA